MKKYSIANWKMNGDSNFVAQYFKELTQLLSENASQTPPEMIFCVPFPYLEHSLKQTEHLPIKIGAQDCSAHLEGAFTGDVSAKMLENLGVDAVIIGHSERRQYHQENAEILRQKIQCALKHNHTVIYCIGENMEQKGNHQTLNVVFQQCQDVLSGLNIANNLIIAYEPIWAIGTGKIPSVSEIESVLQELQKFLLQLLGQKIPLLYGGSVTAASASVLLSSPLIDGLLVGKASLDPQEFFQIASC